MKRRILMDINIKVKDKIAVGDETLIVCGNRSPVSRLMSVPVRFLS